MHNILISRNVKKETLSSPETESIVKDDEGGVFLRFQSPDYREEVNFCNQKLRVCRYDENVSSVFQCDNLPSYIIIEQSLGYETSHVINKTNSIKNGSTGLCSTPKRTSDNARSLDLDLTGSPLECNFLDLKPSEMDSFHTDYSTVLPKSLVKTYSGFPVEKARSIAAKLYCSLKILKTKGIYLPPVWIACDGKDNSKIVFVGFHVKENVNCHLSMTNFGPYVLSEELPSLDRIDSHFTVGALLPRVYSKVEAMYEVLSRKEECSTISLHCVWYTAISTLSPPGLDALTIAVLHIDIRDKKSRAKSLYKEFDRLQNLIEGAANNVIKWYQSKEESAFDRLIRYLENLKIGGGPEPKVKPKREAAADAAVKLDEMVENRFLENRINLEFSDEIWNILKGCQSISELSKCFNQVFQMISSKVIRPKVHVRNDTKFAVVCRDLMRGRCQIPLLNNEEPIEMLIEIGLEKIKKDYISIFQVCDLVIGEELLPYTSWTSRKCPHKDCLSKLEKMHVVLQIVVYLRVVLNIPNSVLVRLTSKTLSNMEREREIPSDFEFQLETSLIKSAIKNVTPSVWIYETWSASADKAGLGKKSRFLIKKDDNFLKMEPENDVVSTSGDQGQGSANPKFYCLSVNMTEDSF